MAPNRQFQAKFEKIKVNVIEKNTKPAVVKNINCSSQTQYKLACGSDIENRFRLYLSAILSD